MSLKDAFFLSSCTVYFPAKQSMFDCTDSAYRSVKSKDVAHAVIDVIKFIIQNELMFSFVYDSFRIVLIQFMFLYWQIVSFVYDSFRIVLDTVYVFILATCELFRRIDKIRKKKMKKNSVIF